MMIRIIKAFVIFGVFHKVYANECEIPADTKEVTLNGFYCTSFIMDPNGNYSALVFVRAVNDFRTELVYDLLDKLILASNLREMMIDNNQVIDILDLARFNPLMKLDTLKIHFNKNVKLYYTAKEENRNMHVLSLVDCNIKTVDINKFYKFPNLVDFSIFSNELSGVLDLGILTKFENLINFHVQSNKITEVINTKKSVKLPKMRWINLGYNKIKFIDYKIFDSFPNLGTLSVGNNMLSGELDLGKLTNMKSLNWFQIPGNGITRIFNSGKNEMPVMGTIILSRNKLTFLNLDDFSTFPNLKRLDLNDNQLVSISRYSNAKSIYPRIEKIAIENNEFYCFELETMVEPYVGTNFWYWYTEKTCSNNKIMFENTTCCYPLKY